MQETQEMWVQSLGQEDPPEKEMAPTPAFLPGKVHGWKSPVGYSPWSHKESDTTERLSTSLLLENGKWMDRLWLLLIHLNLFKDLII